MKILQNYFNDFQVSSHYFITSPLESALEANMSAIPTWSSDSYSVCL